MKSEYAICMERCMECFIDCQECLANVLVKESTDNFVKSCIQCSEVCITTIKYLIGDSPFVEEQVGLCAQVCQWCSEQCHAQGNRHCRICAETCKNCMEECRKLKCQLERRYEECEY